MKKLLLFFFTVLGLQYVNAQINILERAKERAKWRAEQKVNQKVDQSVDKVMDPALDPKKKNKNSKDSTKNNSGVNGNDEGGGSGSKNGKPSLETYSKFDFVPGEKVIAFEDFTKDNIGDFPDKWNTNGSGEIVTVNKAQGRYLMTKKDVVMYPEWVNNLPDNFTLEFDLMTTDKFSYYSGFFVVGATTNTEVGKNFRAFARFGDGRIENGGGFEIAFHPENAGGQQGLTSAYSSKNMQEVLKNEADQNQLMVPEKPFCHISIWRQKGRVRVYMNDKKVWDLPKLVADGLKLSSIYFRNDGANNENDAFYLGNIRVAVGAPDTRNKLITEGKFVTRGILFDVNSDKIKPESYGAIKDIANVLQENADVKVKIIGHTDSDGDDAKNLELSKKRAEAVRQFLIKEFGINAGRMTTDGKGESLPADSNNTPEGKANNRRVEFIKQ
ncbi:MAG: OmpA family protein [Chitinophagaceae bacterium]|nr:OmpA family protein [Chitinophagaceae bacterium]